MESEKPFVPLSPTEIDQLRAKEARGELTADDCRRFIESTRAAWLSRPLPKEKKSGGGGTAPRLEDVDFF